MNETTINFEDLTNAAMEKIGSYPDDVALVFYVKRHGSGYRVEARESRMKAQIDHQGGMGEGWMRVLFNDKT